MRENNLRTIWATGRGATNAWCQIPSAYATELIAHQGWDSLTVDMQHGPIGFSEMVAMLTAIATTPAVPLVRVPWNNPGDVMRAADAGAMGVICPSVNTKAEAESFVGALRYAPMGYRSLGPNRARLLGEDYTAKSNETILAIVQIETAPGLENVEAIASVKGLDMLYVGPSDLGLSLGREGRIDQTDAVVVAAIDRILKTAKNAGIKAGIYCTEPAYSKAMLAKGFDFVTVVSDKTLITTGAGMRKHFV